MEIPLFIDFEFKNGIHEHLKLAKRRGLIHPLYAKYRIFEKFFFKRVPLFFQKKTDCWFPMVFRWGDWIKEIDSHENVVVTANYHTIPLVKYLNKKFPDLNIHVFYFNPIAKDVPLRYFQEYNCKIWSFDKEDCNKYGLNYNNQFVVSENYEDRLTETVYDIIFIGADKGRLKKILEIEQQLKRIGMSSYFHVVSTNEEANLNNYDYKDYLSYDEIVELESKAKAILDFVQDGQSGQTIRPLEAMFLRKKLITNNTSIIEEPYYSRDNIFILGEDDLDTLPKFIDNKINSEIEIYPRYEIKAWLMNFINSE